MSKKLCQNLQNPWPPILPGSVPPRAPQLVTDLEGNHRLAGSGGKRQKHSAFALQDGLDRPIDSDLLVITWGFPRKVVVRGEQSVGSFVIDCLGLAQAAPQIFCTGKVIEVVVAAGQEIVLDDTLAIRRICKLESKDLGVFFRCWRPSPGRS